MANNQYVNKVQFGNTTIMDISDTNAEAGDVLEGALFYAKSGAPTTGTLGDATQSTHGLMSAADKNKLDGINLLGVKLNTSNLIPDTNGYVTIPIMTGATSSAAGAAGLVPAPATTDVDKFLAGDGTYKSGGLPMVILSYGSSTWAEFEAAYNNNVIVYCRASSNSNPASGSQTRMAFMAYVNNATTPTSVEFQYYRSVSSHSATQMGDQVFIYKLDKTSGWSVTTREASIKEIDVASGSKLGVSWSSNKVTLSNTMTADDMPMSSSDATTAKSAIDSLNSKMSSKIFTPSSTSDSILAWVLANIPDRSVLPFSFVKTGSVAVSDSPFSFAQTEFAGTVYGSGERIVVELERYANSNYEKWTRGIFQNNWYGDWRNWVTKDEITTVDLGSDTIANIQNSIVTLGNNLSIGGVKNILFVSTENTGVFVQSRYIGTIFKPAASRITVSIQIQGASSYTITGYYNGTSWSWESLSGNLSSLRIGGIFCGLARSDGRINISIPVQGNFTSISANKYTNISGNIYGSISSNQCTFELQNLSIAGGYIYANLQPDVTLSSYTDLAKITLVQIGDANNLVITMS